MLPLHLLSLPVAFLATTGSSSPDTTPADAGAVTGDNSLLAACQLATNCEVYERPGFGKSFRFVHGMEPGSMWYANNVEATDDIDEDDTDGDFGNSGINKEPGGEKDIDGEKRNNKNSTTTAMLNFGRNIIDYGDMGASGASGAIHRLWDVCHESACDTGETNLPTKFAVYSAGGAARKGNLVLATHGHYGGWGHRGAFVQALEGFAAEGEKCASVPAPLQLGGFRPPPVRRCLQSDFLSIALFSKPGGSMMGFMDVKVRADVPVGQGLTAPGLCGRLAGILSGGVTASAGVAAIVASTNPAAAGALTVVAGFAALVSVGCLW